MWRDAAVRSDAFLSRQPFERVVWCSLAARRLPVLSIASGRRAEAHGIVAAIVAAPLLEFEVRAPANTKVASA